MAQRRDLTWLIDRLKFFLNIDSGQPDQDYVGPSSDTDKWYRDLLNQAGEREVEDAKIECGRDWFRKTYDSTWAAGAVTLAVPDQVREHLIEEVLDVTNDEVGNEIAFANYHPGGAVFWKDNETLQWGTTGPGSATTLRWTYLANFLPMEADSDEPEIIAPRFRWLLVWSALDIAKALGDERVPQDYMRHLTEWREKWWKVISLGRPMKNNPARIQNRDPDFYDPFGY